MTNWHFFFRHESNRIDPRSVPASFIVLDLPLDISLEDAITAARENGMPKGSSRTGCFEIQNDLGIWSQIDGNRIDLTTPRRAAKVIFKTWTQLESEEEK